MNHNESAFKKPFGFTRNGLRWRWAKGKHGRPGIDKQALSNLKF